MEQKIKSNMGVTEWVMLLALSVLWGGSFFFVEVAIDTFPPFTLVTLRVGLAALALWAFAISKGLQIPKDIKLWVAFLGMGLLNNVIPFLLIVWGQTEISSGLAAILNATTPLFTVIVAHVMLADEKASLNKYVGVLIGFLGVILMIGPEVLNGLGSSFFAQIAILGAAISYGFAGVYGRRFKILGVSPVVTAAGQVTASTLVLIPISLYLDQPFTTIEMPSLTVWASILALALFSTALAYILYFNLLSSVGATNLLLVTFLIPVSANILGIGVLGEVLDQFHIFGMMLISAGLFAIDGRLWSQLQNYINKIKP